MKARDVVGRRIVRVDQERADPQMGLWAVLRLYLDNGTYIRFVALEHPEGGDAYVYAAVERPALERSRA